MRSVVRSYRDIVVLILAGPPEGQLRARRELIRDGRIVLVVDGESVEFRLTEVRRLTKLAGPSHG